MSSRSKEAERSARARARRDWPVRKLRLADDHGDDLSRETTAEERLAMMWPLAVEAWSLSGPAHAGLPTRRHPGEAGTARFAEIGR